MSIKKICITQAVLPHFPNSCYLNAFSPSKLPWVCAQKCHWWIVHLGMHLEYAVAFLLSTNATAVLCACRKKWVQTWNARIILWLLVLILYAYIMLRQAYYWKSKLKRSKLSSFLFWVNFSTTLYYFFFSFLSFYRAFVYIKLSPIFSKNFVENKHL